jgi:hypothetical protein
MLYPVVDKRKKKLRHIGYFGNLSLPRMSCPSMDIIVGALTIQNRNSYWQFGIFVMIWTIKIYAMKFYM